MKRRAMGGEKKKIVTIACGAQLLSRRYADQLQSYGRQED